jgi:hypothetical protein
LPAAPRPCSRQAKLTRRRSSTIASTR